MESDVRERDATRRQRDRSPRIFVHLADAYRREGLVDEAIRICRDGLLTHPAAVDGRLVLAQALLQRGATEEAAAEFRRVLDQTPENLPVLRSLGDISAKTGRMVEARAYYERALRLAPGDPETQGRLAALPPPRGAGPRQTNGQGRGENRDPLASPTLAGLYASQGHAERAAAIYSQLCRRLGEAGAATPVSPLLARLRALGEAARRLRGFRMAPSREDERHGR